MPTKHQLVSLSDQTVAVILGSLLGDGSLKLHHGYQNARFSFRHSIRQQEYFDWKVSLLSEISGNKAVFQQLADGFSRLAKLRYQSLALPALTELYKLTHNGNRFRIQRKWLNHMTALSLAIWWCDDGSLIGSGKRGVFCTDGFDETSVKLLARYLQVSWKITTHVAPVSRKRSGRQDHYFRIWIRSSEELKKLLRIIAPYIPKSMLYKVLVLYKDPKLQQRWISELTELTQFSEQEFTSVVLQRKATQAFRKRYSPPVTVK